MTIDLSAMERLREELSEHADRLDETERDMHRVIVQTRKRVRAAIQLFDRLAAENHKLTTVAEKCAAEIVTKDAEIARLTTRVDRLELAAKMGRS